jgi:hypothetical protein
MNRRKNLLTGGAATSLIASLFAVSMAAPALAATVPPVPTTVTPVGATTYVPIAAVTASGTTDIGTGNLILTLPAGFSWAISGAITTVESNGVGGTLAVSDGPITAGGTTATFTLIGAPVAGSTITFSSAPVTATTAGASGDVVLSGLSSPSSVVLARVRAPGAPAKGNDQANGGDKAKSNAQAKGHGARKVAFFLDATGTAFTCPTGAQPIAHAATFGFAILNTTGHNRLNVNVVLKGALPNAIYDVWVNQDPGACPLSAATKAGAIHTNARGNGTANLHVAIVKGATHFWVSAVSGSDVLRTPAAALKIKR